MQEIELCKKKSSGTLEKKSRIEIVRLRKKVRLTVYFALKLIPDTASLWREVRKHKSNLNTNIYIYIYVSISKQAGKK